MTDYVATLIARPGENAALRAAADALAARLRPAVARATWLAQDLALDLAFRSESNLASREIAAAGARDGVDVVVQQILRRRKKLLVADMDSTMINEECIDELADVAGIRPQVAEITERAMRGETTFAPALRARVALLADLPITVVDSVIAKRISLSSGARTLVATMRANGAYTLLVSGGFTVFAEKIAEAIGFDAFRANTLVEAAGRLTGAATEPILGPEAKVEALREHAARLGLHPSETLAVGDGANDIGMIRAAGMGVAYHAKPKVAETAAARIDHNDLTALLYLQGYGREQFVDPDA